MKGRAALTQPQRESIWSVSPQTRDTYFVVFTVLFLGGLALEAHRAYLDGLPSVEVTRAVWEAAAYVAIGAAAASLVLTEVGRIAMVIARRLEEGLERVREQRRAEGREEGREEERQRWLDWYARREAAEGRGERFDEPPPAGD